MERLKNVIKKTKIVATTPCDPDKAVAYTLSYLNDKALPPDMSFEKITETETLRLIDDLKNTKSCGLDGIQTEVLKKFKKIIAPELTKIINRAIGTGKYPHQWKMGKIVPLPKAGDLQDVSNWPVLLYSTE